MSLTFEEVKERLSRIDEVSILEVLEINTQDILDKFEDKILDNIDILAEELEEDDQ
jgi:anion-transporting  ArsA/GET3 family ATPase